MKIWHRYLLKQILASFFFILICLFSIYFLIDLSVNGVRFSRGSSSILEIFLYYIYSFGGHLDLFFPLAFLLSSLKVLFDLTDRFEFLSLQMAGLSLKKILSPFLALACFLSLVSYANHEWLAPQALSTSREFKTAHSSNKQRLEKPLQAIALKDNSEIVFNHFDATKNELTDLFWIRDEQNLWYMRTIQLKDDSPVGLFVDHLEVLNGKLIKTESFSEKIFHELPLHSEQLATPPLPYESRSLSTLFREYSYKRPDQAIIQTHFHRKLSIPLLPILILVGLSPFALTFSRHKPIFLIVALSIFAFIVVRTLFDSFLILGENQILNPMIAMWSVPALILALSIRKFAKI